MNNEIRPRSASKERVVWHSALFVALLAALNLISITLFPGSYQEVLRRMTGRMAALLLLPFGATTFDGLLLTTGGFAMEIAVECTAMQFLMIYTAGVIAYPHHGAGYKVIGIAAGTMVLYLMNVVRIAALGLVGSHVPEAFDFFHIYLWQGILTLLVVGVWIVWVRNLAVDRPLVLKIGTAFAASALGVGVLGAAMPYYLEALVAIARPIAGLLLGGTPYDLTVSRDVIELNIGNSAVWNNAIALNVYNQIIFLALVTTSFGQRRLLKVSKHILYGLAALFLLYIGHVLLFVLEVAQGIPPETIANLDVTVRAFSASACIGLYLLFAGKLRDSRKKLSVDLKGGRINEEIVIAH
ncbi:MAG: exosortase H [Nitrospirota bacterium]